jgi:hypothetical protein
LGFFVAIGLVVNRWLREPIDIYHAFIEVPRVSIRSPADGTGRLHVPVGERVQIDAIVATVLLPEPERRRMDRERLAADHEIAALEARRDLASGRLAGLRSQHASLQDAQESEFVSRLHYESVRDVGIKPFSDGLEILEEATRVSDGLSERLQDLYDGSLASSVEVSEASLRALSYQFHRSTLARDNARADALTQATDRLREAACDRTEIQKTVDLNPDTLSELRLLEQIEFDLQNLRTRRRILDAIPIEHVVEAPCSGRIASAKACTHFHAGDELLAIDCDSEARVRVQLTYGALRRLPDRPASVVRFRLNRSNAVFEARPIGVQRGFVERDRRLRRIDLVELLLVANTPLPDVVPGENVELVE